MHREINSCAAAVSAACIREFARSLQIPVRQLQSGMVAARILSGSCSFGVRLLEVRFGTQQGGGFWAAPLLRYALSGMFRVVSCCQDGDQELGPCSSFQGSSCQELAAWVRPREALFSQLGLYAWLGQVAVGAITAGQEAAQVCVSGYGAAAVRAGRGGVPPRGLVQAGGLRG